jgi:hypothetical protein
VLLFFLSQLPFGFSVCATPLLCRVSLRDLVSQAETLLQEQPSWPKLKSLQMFSLRLLRHTVHMTIFKKWFPRFFILFDGRLHYSDGTNGHPDSKDGTRSFVRSNPAPGARYCVDLKGACSVAVDSTTACPRLIIAQAALLSRAACQLTARRLRLKSSLLQAARCSKEHKHAMSHGLRGHTSCLQAARDVVLAAEDEVTRQRCMRIIQAASTGCSCSPLQSIASAVALTRDLLRIQSLSAVNNVLAALGKAAVDALDPECLKAAGFEAAALAAAGHDFASIKAAGFTAAEAKAAGCDATCAVSAGYDLPSLKAAGYDILSLKAAGFDVLLLVEVFGRDAVGASGCEVSFVLVSCAAALLHSLAHSSSENNPPLPLTPLHPPYFFP